MSSKIGTILSFLFAALFFLFGADMISLQYNYSDLDAKSIPISYEISRSGGLTNSLISQIENNYHVSFTCISGSDSGFGESVEYILSTEFDPMIISKDIMTISIKRITTIGFIG